METAFVLFYMNPCMYLLPKVFPAEIFWVPSPVAKVVLVVPGVVKVATAASNLATPVAATAAMFVSEVGGACA